MKKYVFALFAFILLAGISCQEKIDIEKEKADIIAVIQEEGDAAAAFDIERLTAVHVQDSQDARFSLGENNYSIITGWDEIKSYFEEAWSEMDQTAYGNAKNLKENVILKVMDGCAWLICDNIWKWNYEGEPGGFDNIQITFLEKIEGEWKISFTAFVAKPEPEDEVESETEGIEEGEEEAETEDTD